MQLASLSGRLSCPAHPGTRPISMAHPKSRQPRQPKARFFCRACFAACGLCRAGCRGESNMSEIPRNPHSGLRNVAPSRTLAHEAHSDILAATTSGGRPTPNNIIHLHKMSIQLQPHPACVSPRLRLRTRQRGKDLQARRGWRLILQSSVSKIADPSSGVAGPTAPSF